MEALTTQNRELRSMLIKATEVKSNSKEEEDGDVEMSDGQRSDVVSRIPASGQMVEESPPPTPWIGNWLSFDPFYKKQKDKSFSYGTLFKQATVPCVVLGNPGVYMIQDF